MADDGDVIVVGGGLAGLAAATYAARAGRRVTVIEARSSAGGRARSTDEGGFLVDEGAHALYLAGAGRPILRELGVGHGGRMPPYRELGWFRAGELLASLRAKVGAAGGTRAVRAVRALASTRAADRVGPGASMADWIDRHADDERTRDLLLMLVRTTTYVADPTRLDARAGLAQARRGLRGVHYLHGGWQTLVDGLAATADAAGVERVDARVAGVTADGDGFVVATADERDLAAASVVVAAGGPGHADRLLHGASPTLARRAADAVPVLAACLDVGLRRRTATAGGFGLGEPTYVVDFARSARVAPRGTSLLHALWYEPDLVAHLDPVAELEARVEQVAPGWADDAAVVHRRRAVVVSHDRPRPGVARPGVEVDDVPGLFVAGDWITTDGLLADAALASGRLAGRAAAERAAMIAGGRPVPAP